METEGRHHQGGFLCLESRWSWLVGLFLMFSSPCGYAKSGFLSVFKWELWTPLLQRWKSLIRKNSVFSVSNEKQSSSELTHFEGRWNRLGRMKSEIVSVSAKKETLRSWPALAEGDPLPEPVALSSLSLVDLLAHSPAFLKQSVGSLVIACFSISLSASPSGLLEGGLPFIPYHQFPADSCSKIIKGICYFCSSF